VSSSSAPPGLDSIVEEVARRESQRPPAPPSKRDVLKQFEVRRFAGPTRHVEQVEHLRIAHLTDLHVGRVTPMEVQYKAVDLANEAQPDLVVLTGDFVCHSQAWLDELTEVIQRFDAPVVCVLGNHDHWSGPDEVRCALRRGGAEVLDNRHTVITLRHERLQVVGLDDAYTGHADWRQAVKGLRHDLPTLGLSHIAEEADALWSADVPLVLSGHTHAGQVTLARLHELSIGRFAGHRYVHGLYGRRRPDENGLGAVYVGAGIGAALVPLRLGDRGKRELTIFELGHEPGTLDEHHDEQPALRGRKPSPRTQWKRYEYVEKKAAKRAKKNGKHAVRRSS
jgi:predicted MPP superfamily phosphohydrolase